MSHIYLTGTTGKENELVSFINLTFYSLHFSLYSEHWLRDDVWDHGVHNCFPPQISYRALMLKINKSNPFVSLIYSLISTYFISELSQMRINFYCAFPYTGERMSSCMKFLTFFFFFPQSPGIFASQHSFSTWLFEERKEERKKGKKEGYRTGTEHQADRALGYCVFFFRRERKKLILAPKIASSNTHVHCGKTGTLKGGNEME